VNKNNTTSEKRECYARQLFSSFPSCLPSKKKKKEKPSSFSFLVEGGGKKWKFDFSLLNLAYSHKEALGTRASKYLFSTLSQPEPLP